MDWSKPHRPGMLLRVTLLPRRRFWIGAVLAATSSLWSCTASLAQSAQELPSSDRRTALERWAPSPDDVLLFERLRNMPRETQTLQLAGAEGTSAIVDGKLELRVDEPGAVLALLPTKSQGGPFVVEVNFDQDNAAGLVLVREKDGKPDPENYTSICVETDAEGVVRLSVRDRQNGRADVFDSRFAPPMSATQPASTQPATATTKPVMDPAYRARFSTPLAGQFSVPARKTSGKLRIFRDIFSGMIRFYCEVRPEILGEARTGFIELQSTPEWDNYAGPYYAGPAVRSSTGPAAARFSNWRIFRTTRIDRDDRSTGFKVVRRDYNFSGYSAEALVVSFGREFAYRDADRKLVFWSAANYVPFWHLDEQLGLSYEFIETWSKDPAEGCFEPMSDRLLRFSRVSTIRDNAVRKRIQWTYTLINPDYVPLGAKSGAKELPEVEETWVIHPDGTVLREQRYYPPTDGREPLQWNQVAELDPILGAKTTPEEMLAKDTITVTGLSGAQKTLTWPGKEGDFTDPTGRELAAFVTARFAPPGMPDAFLAFVQGPRFSATAPLELNSTWHRKQWWTFSHWPANYQPYQSPTNSQAALPGQITHGGLIGVGATRSPDWSADFHTDRNGRKYRRWLTMLGLEKQGDTAATLRRVNSWLYGATITDVRGCRYMGYDAQSLEHRFWVEPGQSEFSLQMRPHQRTKAAVRPLLRVEGWGEGEPEVRVTGVPLNSEEMKWAVENGDLLIWINREITDMARIRVTVKPGKPQP